VVKQLLNLTKAKPVDFVGKTNILQLAALIKNARLPDAGFCTNAFGSGHGRSFYRVFRAHGFRASFASGKALYSFERDLKCAPCYSVTCKIATTRACVISLRGNVQKIKELIKVS